MKVISIIVTHFAQHAERSEVMRRSMESLIATTREAPVEIIVADNGGNIEDSRYLLDLVENKKIQHYVRNAENIYFGWARNIGYEISSGEYLVFADNDIEYKQGWLEDCVKLLEAFPEDRKLMVTPLAIDRLHWVRKEYHRGQVNFEGRDYHVNTAAGSNCWLMRRKDFEIIGKFKNNVIAGTLWMRRYASLGYAMITHQYKDPKATDIGFKKGYDRHQTDIAKVFSNGQKLVLNEK